MPRAIWKAKQTRSAVVRQSESALTEQLAAACDDDDEDVAGFTCSELT